MSSKGVLVLTKVTKPRNEGFKIRRLFQGLMLIGFLSQDAACLRHLGLNNMGHSMMHHAGKFGGNSIIVNIVKLPHPQTSEVHIALK